MAAVSNPDIVHRVNDLVSWSRAEGNLVIWCCTAEPGTARVRPAGGTSGDGRPGAGRASRC